MTFYDRIIRAFAGIIRLLYRVEIVGEEHIPEEGQAYLLCANHTAAADPVILVAALKRKVVFFAKAELFRIPLIGRVIRALDAIPVRRGAGDVGAIRSVLSSLEQRRSVGIFPQGHRYPGVDPRTTEPKAGIGMIVSRTGAPVLPVYLQARKNRVRMFRKTRVIIGELIPERKLLPAAGEPTGMEQYRAVTQTVFEEICRLGEESKP
ncbi:MAG: 1-acyl-sn-glycerol-3-phosphate acyltransferase [Clostridia bacterium]|nr:1-acyl-sn-glycerol-3-phosphate acyltransferase [Clostridia bacterium]